MASARNEQGTSFELVSSDVPETVAELQQQVNQQAIRVQELTEQHAARSLKIQELRRRHGQHVLEMRLRYDELFEQKELLVKEVEDARNQCIDLRVKLHDAKTKYYDLVNGTEQTTPQAELVALVADYMQEEVNPTLAHTSTEDETDNGSDRSPSSPDNSYHSTEELDSADSFEGLTTGTPSVASDNFDTVIRRYCIL